jgi:hypothetical protein
MRKKQQRVYIEDKVDISCGLLSYFFHYLLGQKLFLKDLEVKCEIK